MSYIDPTKRHDFVLLFDVTRGNPNGDPDADNLPRVDPETMHGLITDVCLKRKIRDYVSSVLGQPIFIQSKVALNTLITKAFVDVGVEPVSIIIRDEEVISWLEQNPREGFSLEPLPEQEGIEASQGLQGSLLLDDSTNGDEEEDEIEARLLIYSGSSTKPNQIENELLEEFEETDENKKLKMELKKIAKTLVPKKVKGKKGAISEGKREEARLQLCKSYYDIRMFGAVLSTGLNAGQVRGPMQLTFAHSIDPIFRHEQTLTRQARTTTERQRTKEGSTEFGRKAIVPYGFYRAHGFYNPALAKHGTESNLVTEDDLKYFWEALCEMFENDHSASRGEMVMHEVCIFTHENPKGNAHSHKLFDRIKVQKKLDIEVPRASDDYQIDVEQQHLPSGVTLTKLSEQELCK